MSVQSLDYASLNSDTLRILISSLSDPAMIADLGGRIIASNVAAEHLLSVYPSMHVGDKCSELSNVYLPDGKTPCPPDRLPIVRALRGETVESQDLLVGKPGSGKIRHIRSNAAPLRDESKKLAGAIVICRDMTRQEQQQQETIGELQNSLSEQKRVEQSLLLLAEAGETLQKHLDYRETLQGVADLTIRLIADQCLCDVLDGEQLKRVAWGVRRPELRSLLQRAVEWLPPAESPHPIARAIATGEPALLTNIDDEAIRAMAVNEEHAKAFRALGVDSILSVPIKAYGQLMGVFTLTRSKTFGREFDERDTGVAVELGRRVGVAVHNALSHERLLESEKRFRRLAESVPQLVWACRRNGFCEYMNSHWTAFTGLAIEASLQWGWLEAVHPEDRNKAREFWSGSESDAGGSHRRAEFRLRSSAGAYRWLRTTAARVHDLPGSSAHWVAISIDIEDDKALEGTRLEQSQELIRSNTELQKFAYVVAHDLREPLRTVQSFSQMLTRSLPEEIRSETKEVTDFIHSGVARMDALISGLLSYAQVGAGDDHWQTVDCNQVVAATLEQLSAVIASSHAEINCAPLPTVEANEVMLAQLFQNLISNALKYRGDSTPCIHISGRWAETECIFAIQDNGPGISRENHERIFGLFQRLHGRDVPGIGLGLANCAKIVDRHGGRIWVESELGRGATFFFTVPKREAGGASTCAD